MALSPTFTKGELIELIPCILEEIERAEEQGREDDKTQFEEELKHFHSLFLQREDDHDDYDGNEYANEASRLLSSSSSSDLMDIDNEDGDDSSSLLSGLASSDDLKDNGGEDEQKGKAVLKLRGHYDAKGKRKGKEKEENPKPKYNCKCGCGSKNVSRQKILDHKKAKGKKLRCKQTKDNDEPCASISGTARDFKNHHKTVHHWNEEQLKGMDYDWSEGREDGFPDPEDPNWMAVDERYVEEPEEEAEDNDDGGSDENEDDEEIEDIE